MPHSDFSLFNDAFPVFRGFFLEGCTWCENYIPVIDHVICADQTILFFKHYFSQNLNFEEVSDLYKFNVNTFPSIVAFNSDFEECSRLIGFNAEDKLQNWINDIKTTCQ